MTLLAIFLSIQSMRTRVEIEYLMVSLRNLLFILYLGGEARWPLPCILFNMALRHLIALSHFFCLSLAENISSASNWVAPHFINFLEARQKLLVDVLFISTITVLVLDLIFELSGPLVASF